MTVQDWGQPKQKGGGWQGAWSFVHERSPRLKFLERDLFYFTLPQLHFWVILGSQLVATAFEVFGANRLFKKQKRGITKNGDFLKMGIIQAGGHHMGNIKQKKIFCIGK